MSQFEVRVYKLTILPHPNADKIELAQIGDFLSVVGKDQFRSGDLGAYIPEASVLPLEIIQELGVEGKLSGSSKNRVRAARLRGVLSQGLVLPARKGWKEGDDVAEELGIKKYEPKLPANMRGKAVGVDQDITVNYDIENIKKHNQIFSEEEAEVVAMTEKIHGTFVQFGYIPLGVSDPAKLYLGAFTVTSKGLGGRGILLDHYDMNNVYTKMAQRPDYGLYAKLVAIRAEYLSIFGKDSHVYLCGEIFGPGVQVGFDYGVPAGKEEFRVFDIAFGKRSVLQYLPFYLVEKICQDYEIPMVPVLYKGQFSKEALEKTTTGNETVSGRGVHMREGVVVKPYYQERRETRAGRCILKSVSPAYLLRKGEVTEYQ